MTTRPGGDPGDRRVPAGQEGERSIERLCRPRRRDPQSVLDPAGAGAHDAHRLRAAELDPAVRGHAL